MITGHIDARLSFDCPIVERYAEWGGCCPPHELS